MKKTWKKQSFASRNVWPAAAILMMTIAVPASAQDVVRAQVEGITTHGHAELKVKPDVAYVSLSVTTQARDQATAVKTNATRSVALLAALKADGIASADIQTQFYTLEPQYDYNSSPPYLSGFQVTNSFQVTIHDLTTIGEILDAASQTGSTQAGDIRFDVADHDKYSGEALVEAVADAKSRADLMAGAAGVTLGHLISLNDSQAPTVTPVMFAARTGLMAATAQPVTPVENQQVDITADVVAVYSIEADH